MEAASNHGAIADSGRSSDSRKMEECSWIRRVRFSSSIYHRRDLPLSWAITIKPKVSIGSGFESSGSDFNPPSLSSKGSLRWRSPSGPLSFRSAEAYTSSSLSAASSPATSLTTSSSFGSSCSCEDQCSDKDPSSSESAASSPAAAPGRSSSFGSFPSGEDQSSDEDPSLRVKRIGSWCEYLEGSFRNETLVVDPAAEHWRLDMSQLFLGHKFATGCYSRLYYGLYKGQEVAVKLIRPPDEDSNVARRLESQFSHEVSLLSRLHHPNVVQFVAALKRPAVYGIITEYLSNGSLRSFLNKSGPNNQSVTSIVRMALDIARGMEYLHSQGVIHRDLKSENLCLDKDLCVKITDFGVSCHFTEDYLHTKDTGTYRWMAPEMICQKPYTKKVDVYSFGIVLWELLSGTIPFKNMTAAQSAFAVVNKHLRPEVPPTCPQVLENLMRQCWSENPERRPDFWEIVKKLEQFEKFLQQNSGCSRSQNPLQHMNLISRYLKRCHIKHPLLT